jgi:hypothetical protein
MTNLEIAIKMLTSLCKEHQKRQPQFILQKVEEAGISQSIIKLNQCLTHQMVDFKTKIDLELSMQRIK